MALTGLLGCEVGTNPGPVNGEGQASCTQGPLGPAITNLDSLDACCEEQGGGAHCIDAGVVDPQFRDQLDSLLAKCDGGGLCVPDNFLTTGGAVPPRDCSAFGGDGVCVSTCVPQVQENAALLQQDVCDSGELCVPCINPLDGQPTGACDLRTLASCEQDDTGGGQLPVSTCENPTQVIDPGTFPACAPDAHCIDANLVRAMDADNAERFAECQNAPGSLCVPDVMSRTGGAFTLAACSSVSGFDGRCVSVAVPEVGASADLLPQANCAPTERCAPCTDPVDGSSNGICGISCDTTAFTPGQVLATCGNGDGRCVPNADIPADQLDDLDERDCDNVLPDGDNYKCVSQQVLNGGPYVACNGDAPFIGNYIGTCINKEIPRIPFDGFLSNAQCDDLFGDDYACVPCVQGGDPTGAPGCDQLYPQLAN